MSAGDATTGAASSSAGSPSRSAMYSRRFGPMSTRGTGEPVAATSDEISWCGSESSAAATFTRRTRPLNPSWNAIQFASAPKHRSSNASPLAIPTFAVIPAIVSAAAREPVPLLAIDRTSVPKRSSTAARSRFALLSKSGGVPDG